ncbi:MAG: ribosome small subunit-dependent GTPase A [Treponema sp.]|jgi:ribosome biogenesis GTPase|nr:ribosome small subunit-dependent GTPase A [Treponema sp.]
MLSDLKDYGFTQTDFLAAQNILQGKNTKESITGRVIEARRDRFKVICEHGELSAELKGSFFHNLEEGDLFPVVGDFVFLKYNSQGPSLIDAVLPRRSMFSRVDFLGHAEGFAKNVKKQVLVSNFDYVFILSSLNYDLNMNRLARYLTATWQSGGFPVIILTKADLCEDHAAKAAEVRKLNRDIPVIPISSKTGFGIDELAPFLEPGKTIVFLGSSGVGKSSLLNRLAGEELMEVKEIREDDSKGRHTTTHRQLFRIAAGALVIDTPGMREMGLWDAQEGISLAFAEVEELFSQCRFSNCTHQSEPGCAVLAALEDGSLSPAQWKTYLAQRKETAFVMNHSAYLKQKQEFHKSIARYSRDRNKGKEIY